MENRTLREIVEEIKSEGVRCNCDLDNWQPETTTGHSWVCRIHKMALERKRREARHEISQ